MKRIKAISGLLMLLIIVLVGGGAILWAQTYKEEPTPALKVQPQVKYSSQKKMISSSPYRALFVNNKALSEGNLILVNNQIFYPDNMSDQFTSVYDFKNNSYQVKDKSVKLTKETITHLNGMMADFETQTGLTDVMALSGYRSAEDQERVMLERIKVLGEEEAKKLVALPYGSEHHTGLALDFTLCNSWGQMRDYDGTGDYSWLNQNAYRYGFIVRYKTEKESITGIQNEPWHFRYVGQPHATYMNEHQLCLEEYIELLKKYPFEGKHLYTTDDRGNQYEIYYVPLSKKSTLLPLPLSGDYTVSGNNQDGYIITNKYNLKID